MNTTKFTNKEEYLAYRSNWKAEYKQLSKDIRTLKAEMRESGHQITWSEFSQLKKLKTNATEMLDALKQAKVEAQKQYLASKANQTVNA